MKKHTEIKKVLLATKLKKVIARDRRDVRRGN